MMKVNTLSAWLVMLLAPDSFTNRAAAVNVGKAWNTALSTMPSNWLSARGFRGATAFMATGSSASLDLAQELSRSRDAPHVCHSDRVWETTLTPSGDGWCSAPYSRGRPARECCA